MKLFKQSMAAVLAITCMAASALVVSAEGTKDMTSDGGDRAYTERYQDSLQYNMTTMHVYLKAGETAYFGSSVADASLYNIKDGTPCNYLFSNSAMGTDLNEEQLNYVNTADIYVTKGDYANIADAIAAGETPGKTDVTLIDLPSDATNTTAGYIYNAAQEKGGVDLNGNGTGYKVSKNNTISDSTTGYVAGAKTTANTLTAAENSIYTVVFFSSNHTNNDPLIEAVDDTTPFAKTQGNGSIASWDISVYDNGKLQTGRVFTSLLNLNAGSNAYTNSGTSTGSFNTTIYTVTSDGYEYKLDLNGLDPSEISLYASKRGLLSVASDKSTSSLYHSVRSDRNTFSDLDAHNIVLNQIPTDEALDNNYTLFFEEPSSELLTALHLNTDKPSSADNKGISDFTFTGDTNKSGVGSVGKGGTFSFTSSNTTAGSYQITLNFGIDNTVTLSNTLVLGTNSIYWDGKDAKGNYVSAKTYSNVSMKLKSGEVHFPLQDAEQNPNGIKVTRLNGDTADQSTVYYNNSSSNTKDASAPWTSDYWTVGDQQDAMNGVDSSNGAMAYTNTNTAGTSYTGDGDNAIMDVWAYGSSADVNLSSYSYTLQDTKFTANVTWSEKPVSTTMTLEYSDGSTVKNNAAGSAITNPVTLETTKTSYTWEHLDPTKTYKVVQTPITGYTTVVTNPTGSVENGYASTIANTYTTAKLTVTCNWDNTDIPDTSLIPTSMTIHVYTDAAKTHEILDENSQAFTLSKADNWKKEISNLDPTKTYYVYEVENDATGYKCSPGGMALGNATVGFTASFTNTYLSTNTVTALVLIQWADDGSNLSSRPAGVPITLYQNGKSLKTYTITADTSWYYAWSGLEKTDNNGQAYKYTFSAAADLDKTYPAYTVATDPADPPLVLGNLTSNIYNFTYQPASFTVNSTWNNATGSNLPTSAEVQLQQSVDGSTYTNYGSPVTLTSAENWAHTWTNLPSYTSASIKIQYKAVETVPNGYTAVYSNVDTSANQSTQSITNNYNYTKITVSEASKASRPSSVKIKLLNGANSPYDFSTLNAAGNWSYTFNNVPTVDENGNSIDYSLLQTAVKDYKTAGGTLTGNAADGYTVSFTNTYSPEPVVTPVPNNPSNKTAEDTANTTEDSNPDTKDGTNSLLWAALWMLSCGAAVVCGIRKKKYHC